MNAKPTMTSVTTPVRLVIDCSSDGKRAAYACLIVDPPNKPRLIYGTATDISTGAVETWGINKAIRRANARYSGTRPLVVFTDNLPLSQAPRNDRVQLRWLSRDERLIQYLHDAANQLRVSMESLPPERKPAAVARKKAAREHQSANPTVPKAPSHPTGPVTIKTTLSSSITMSSMTSDGVPDERAGLHGGLEAELSKLVAETLQLSAETTKLNAKAQAYMRLWLFTTWICGAVLAGLLAVEATMLAFHH